MQWMPREPMLAAPMQELIWPPGWVAEPKWDGFRALLAREEDGGLLLRSRRGTVLTRAFPELTSASMAAAWPRGAVADGELVVWHEGRLAFERLTERLNRRPGTVARLAATAPANLVVFDLLHDGDRPLLDRPYAERRAALEELFTYRRLGPPWTLCPATTDEATAREWLDWSTVGMEGLVLKNPAERYRPGVRAWRKYRRYDTTEAVLGAVTGTPGQPRVLILGRLDAAGVLRYTGRTGTLPGHSARVLGEQLAAPVAGHPWTGARFSAGWGSRDTLQVALVEPSLVVEVEADVALDSAGRWRHPVRYLRLRPDLAPGHAPPFRAP
jgi:ATP-dependent DNA ligase